MKKLLIANRGEIAVRIANACAAEGIATVAVYSEADAEAIHRWAADESVCIGPAKAADSYLNFDKVLGAAKETGAEAIHPGYGFLSENAAFAKAVQDAGLIWVGPPADAIAAMRQRKAREYLAEAQEATRQLQGLVESASEEPDSAEVHHVHQAYMWSARSRRRR